MKKHFFILFLACLFAVVFTADAQKKQKSPAAKTEGRIGEANIVIEYSQPSARDRKVMGGLIPFGQVWRTGANNATVFSVDKDVRVEGQTLPAGKYALFTIPNKDEWTIIFNKKTDQWGAFNYNEEDDVLRVKVKPGQAPQFIETFNIGMDEKGVILGWENTNVRFNIEN